MPTYQGTSGNDTIRQSELQLADWTDISALAGDDLIVAGISRIEGGAGNDRIEATSLFTTVVFWSSPSGIQGDLLTGVFSDGWGTQDVLTHVRVVQGSGYADSVWGSNSNDEFWANAGDFFDGRAGTDRLVIWDSAARWTWQWDAAGAITATPVSGGAAITARNVEKIVFSDLEVAGVGLQQSVAFKDSQPVFPQGAFLVTQGVDANIDGRMDIIVAAGISPPQAIIETAPRLLLQQVDGTFREASIAGSVEGFIHPREIAQGDFNGDGWIDFVVVGHGYDTAPFPGETSTVWISDGQGGWTDRSEWMPADNSFAHSVAVADLNRDGLDDLYLGNIWGQSMTPPRLLVSHGSGFWQAALPAPVGADALSSSGVAPIASLLRDMDADGLIDLVAGSGGRGNWLFRGVSASSDPTRYFSDTGMRLPAGLFGATNTTTVDIVATDLNSDGRLDLLLSQTAELPSYQGVGIQVLIQNAQGGFDDETDSRLLGLDRSGSWALFIEPADLTGDGYPDILLNGTSGTGNTAFINNGQGVFMAADGTPTPQMLLRNAIADGPGTVLDVTLGNEGKVTVTRLSYAVSSQAVTPTKEGSSADDHLQGTVADDVFRGLGGNDRITGGEGIDTLVATYLPTQYSLVGNVLSGAEGRDFLTSVERVRFGAAMGAAFTSDIATTDLADPDGDGPLAAPATAQLQQISDLYVAYFNRAPDIEGLLYWFAEISSGRWKIDQVASSFTDQAEYRKAYPAGQAVGEFISTVYANLFDRSPDAEGFDYWSNELARGMPRDTFILSVIQGAYAPTGSAADKALLNHKHAVSLYYSEQLALHPGKAFDLAIDQVLNRVDYLAASMTNAEKVIDYLMNNEVTLTGLSQDVALWDSLWA